MWYLTLREEYNIHMFLKKVINKIPRSMRDGIKCTHYTIRHFKIHTIYLVLLSWQYQGCYDELGNWHE